METLWFWLIGFMLATYVVLDGFDLGAGVLHLFVARTEEERERSCGPLDRSGMEMRSGCWRRRRHRIGVPDSVCNVLQRLLSSVDDGAVVTHGASAGN